MCERQTTKKYIERPSPPYPANKCPNELMEGNDGGRWFSVKDKKGIHTWKPMDSPSSHSGGSPKSKSPRSSGRKRSPASTGRNAVRKNSTSPKRKDRSPASTGRKVVRKKSTSPKRKDRSPASTDRKVIRKSKSPESPKNLSRRKSKSPMLSPMRRSAMSPERTQTKKPPASEYPGATFLFDGVPYTSTSYGGNKYRWVSRMSRAKLANLRVSPQRGTAKPKASDYPGDIKIFGDVYYKSVEQGDGKWKWKKIPVYKT